MLTQPQRTPDLSVVLIVLNGAGTIGEQLAALASQRTSFTWELVVADNGSTDSTHEILAEWAKKFPVPLVTVDASQQRGIAFARNRGAEAARGAMLAFCDCDDHVSPTWVEAAAVALQNNAVVTGVTQPMGSEAPGKNEHHENPPAANEPKLQGGNFGIRRSVFKSVGGFDTSLPPYGNDDSELHLRLREKGHTVSFAPEMHIMFRPTTNLRSRILKIYRSGLSEVVIWRKHPALFAESLSLSRAWVEILRWPLWSIRRVASGGFRQESPKVLREAILRVAHLVELSRGAGQD